MKFANRTRSWAGAAAAALMLASSLSCSVNILETFADKNSNEALYQDALTLINHGEYDAALGKIAAMSDDYAGREQVVTLKASAYAGLCGLNFLNFVEDLGNMGATRLFPFLLGEFKGGSPARIDACRTAQDLIESIGPVGSRTSDENMLMVLVSFAKIGNVLSLYADSDQDGVTDAGLNPCTFTPRATRPSTPVSGDWYEDDLREFGTGVTLAIENITAVSSSIDLGADSLSDINDACGQFSGPLSAYNFCSITDPTAFDGTQLKGVMSLLKESSVVGLGSDCTGDITACYCP